MPREPVTQYLCFTCVLFSQPRIPSLEESRLNQRSSARRLILTHVLCSFLTQKGYHFPSCGVYFPMEPVGGSHGFAQCPLEHGEPCFLISVFHIFINVVLKEHVLFLWCLRLSSQPMDKSGHHMTSSGSTFYIPSCHVIVFYFSRMEDLTNPEDIRTNVKCDRKVSLYGYLRGAYLKNNSQIHMPGILLL